MHKLFADQGQLTTLKEMLARTTRGIEQTRANIKRIQSYKHEPGSKLAARQVEAIERLEDIVMFQERVIATLTAILKGV